MEHCLPSNILKTHTIFCQLYKKIKGLSVSGKNYSSVACLKNHGSIHAPPKYSCNLCDRSFYTNPQLDVHKRKDHYGIRLQCSKCPKSFLGVNSLGRHELVHTGIRKYACSNCPNKFFTITELKRHINRQHLRIERFKCEMCNKTFYEKSSYHKHLLIHTNRPYHKCPNEGCPKEFIRKNTLQRHLRNCCLKAE